MSQAIRVTVTSVYEYTPNLEDNEYLEKQVSSVEDALELDRTDYGRKFLTLDELCYNEPKVTTVWEIVEDPT